METIVIEGRTFQVEKDGDKYILTGARGAQYYTMRNVPNPTHMFLINAKGFTRQAPKTWLTDRNGKLEVLR